MLLHGFIIMNDNDFLNKIINSFKQIEDGLPNLITIIKGLDSKILYASNIYAIMVGKSINELLGTTGLPPKTGKYDPKLSIEEDNQVITQRCRHEFLKIGTFCNKIQPLIVLKDPIINPATQNVTGIFYIWKKLSMSSFGQEIITSFNVTGTDQTRITHGIKLSKREKQVIFLFLTNLSSQEIAKALSLMDNKTITKSTVDGLFTEQLFVKFEVHSRVALREKLISLGFDRVIPKELLISISIPLHEMSTY